MKLVITAENQTWIKGVVEMIINQHLGILERISEFNQKQHVTFLLLKKNKMAVLTRLRKTWLRELKYLRKCICYIVWETCI